jgi:hypothetical protein
MGTGFARILDYHIYGPDFRVDIVPRHNIYRPETGPVKFGLYIVDKIRCADNHNPAVCDKAFFLACHGKLFNDDSLYLYIPARYTFP